MNLRRWLTPGIGVKRWLLVVFFGLLLLAMAFAHMLRQISRDFAPTGPSAAFIDLITLQFLPFELRGLIVGVVGVALVGFGAYRVLRVVTDPLRLPDADQPLVELIYQKRFLAKGPRIVAIGGGTGLSALLRGLKEHTSNLTAVVTVADDGGSSGVLRHELGIPPVGDIRNCIAALADAEPLMNELLQYRFPANDGLVGATRESPGLAGHAVGNLLLAAMTAIEGGDFEEGVRRLNRILAVRGQVVPVSAAPLTLHALTTAGDTIDGQSRIMRTEGIERVWLTPDAVEASDDALAAIAEADLIVLGPGSLYTSVLPSLLIPSVRDAVLTAPATRLYVCNVATQEGETTGVDLSGHVVCADRAYRARPRRSRPGQQPVRRPDPRGLPRRNGPAGLASDRHGRRATAGPRRRRRSRERRITTTRFGWPARSCGVYEREASSRRRAVRTA